MDRDFLEILKNDASFLIAAHEIKAPLSTIRQLSLVLEGGELTEKEQNRVIKHINATSERALRTVQDLTKLSRLDDAMFKMEPIHSKKICADIYNEMSEIFKINDRKLVVKYGKRNDLVVANYNMLKSIIANFADNALYSSDKKTSTIITISDAKGKVRISVRDYGKEVPLSVWRSMNKKSHNKENGIKPRRSSNSSGLGMFISKNFASSMGATVGVIKHKNGSTFYVDLNRSEQLSLL